MFRGAIGSRKLSKIVGSGRFVDDFLTVMMGCFDKFYAQKYRDSGQKYCYYHHASTVAAWYIRALCIDALEAQVSDSMS